ncbi:MAG: hypothetical protein H7325_08905 [Pedobacter sp.]|nr:hypothetical protein [Pedobacter sp.]
MKQKNTLIVLLLIFATSFAACKKDATSLKSQLIGKWNVSKIIGPDLVSIKVTGNDYFSFSSNNDDQLERSLNGETRVGSYIVVSNTFNMSFSEANYYCTNVVISATSLQFDGKNDKTNKTSTYYLTR